VGYLATKSLLARGARPTAIFAGDQAAVGVYRALQESRIRIPDDISVAGFNDTVRDLLYPALTTVREFPRELRLHLAEFTLAHPAARPAAAAAAYAERADPPRFHSRHRTRAGSRVPRSRARP
jgi:DNA-binding LacI/PurR family transcriptional regulator